MRDPLFGIRLKLQRAEEQIHALKADMDAFHEGDPYGASSHFKAELRTLALVARVHKPCPGMWGIQIGEIAHNLRSALDHLVWELVIHHTGSPPTGSKSGFPIFETETGYRNRAGPLIAGVSPEARALIEARQPFATGDGILSPLWGLYELSNFDKHRTLHLTGATLEGVELKFSGLAPHIRYEVTARPAGPFKHDTVFLTVRFPGTEWPFAGSVEKVKVQGPMRFGVAFDEGSPAAGMPVLPVLRVIARRVIEIVQQFAKEILRV